MAPTVHALRALVAIKDRCGGQGKLFAAHLHHGLRGPAADADEAWLRDFCRKMNVFINVAHADVATAAADTGDGWESAARDLRYDFLRQTAEKLGARHVATAHTADDQVETVLHRMIRGTGLAGLAGIPKFRSLSPSVTLARPILAIRRRELLGYLAEIGQDFRVDASNVDPHFTRNRLRNELLPLLRDKFNSEVDSAVLRLASQAREAQYFIERQVTALSDDCIKRVTSDGLQLDCLKLAGQPPLLVCEVCRAAWSSAGWPQQGMGYQEWEQLASLVERVGDVPAVQLPGGVRAERINNVLLLSRGNGFS